MELPDRIANYDASSVTPEDMVHSFDGICTNNYLLITLIEPKNETSSGIYLPDTALDKPRWGWVLSVGEGLSDVTGQVHKPPFSPGDLIYFMQHAPEKADYSDRGLGVLYFVSEGDVWVKLKVAQDEDGNKITKIIPMGNFINIEPLEDTVKKQTEGGIFLPDQVVERPSKARVLAVGVGQRTMGGFYAPRVKPGDIVRYRNISGFQVKFDDLGVKGGHATIIPYGDILAVEVDDFDAKLKERLNEYHSRIK